MEEKTEVLALSDEVDGGECDDGTVSPTPVTVPKKRGRPAHADKPKKAAPSGRGRGRPSGSGIKKSAKAAATADGTEEEGTGSDDASPMYNGDSAEAPIVVASKRGRTPKVKRKLNHIVESTGKGRGRPKKIKNDGNDDDEEAVDSNKDAVSGKKSSTKAAKKGRGRPKKVQTDESSDDKQDDYEEKRSVGRPPSGGVKLNIVSTGRSQGRPKKNSSEKRLAEGNKRGAETENGDDEVPKQRGRPTTSGKRAHSPTGKPRGRPKLSEENKDSEDDEEDAEKVEENADDGEDEINEVNSESEDDE